MRLRILIGMVLMSLFLPCLAAGSPQLTVQDREHDFGEILQGRKVSHVFTFRNSGDSDLVIEQVRSSCGCTAALLSSRSIPPGALGELEAVFDSGRFRGDVSKNITLHTNAAQTPRVTFVVRATVSPEIDLSPQAVDFGVLSAGVAREVPVTVTNRGDREIVLGTPRATAPGIEVKMEPGPLPPGESREMTVRAVPATSAGVRGYVMLRADGAAVPDLRLSVYGRGER